ncbi:hypothetical protein EWM62_15355 [Mucilaginibacter terrigena]|uniref:Chemotaxis methyl-accepting receptor HlyB-like 4HB MCP domain-containing protein n=1 Tax=Mucilaginibacter terrigena TaxID=2492395 RepID=A0A4Q5LI80_9SPHI|nr:MCP four helix bundle domain-containing protein [Mucilaginibacter terrigena]RYU87870.1 hypothetical protein EWM62_15355 [Mucilaginibacter terrigena]
MKWAYSLKYKVRAALVLTALTTILLLVNWGGRSDVAQLDRTLTSLLKDRLMPATFVHDISNRLYENKILAANNTGAEKIKANYLAIEQLIKKYEATQLTPEEALQWKKFRVQLKALKSMEDAGSTTPGLSVSREAGFHTTIQYLDNLIRIQVGESDRLIISGKATVSSNILTANIGAAMCIILALFTLVILSATDRALFRPGQRHNLN